MPGPPRIALLQGGHQSEHRQITVLMTDLVDFTAFVERAGEEAAFALVSHVSGLTTAAIHHHRGTVKNFTGDGILALFGTPTALEDGPLRACRAALEIQQRLAAAGDSIEAELGVRPRLRIGLTTGPVVLGAVDSGESTGVTAHGDIVNLASRLQNEAAPGTVVMSEALLRQVEGMVETQSAGLFRLKGKSELQPVYRLISVRDNATRFDAAVARGLTSYIGRSSELAVLENQFQRHDSVRVVDVVGDPGIGKSRLLYEFALRHNADQILVLRGNCSADGQETPFLPFIEVVRRGFSVSSRESLDAISRKLDEGLNRLSCWSAQNRALLLNLLGLEIPDDALAELDGTLVGARTRDLLLRLVVEQSRFSTIMLLLEDLHWIDSASEDLLLRIVGHEPALPLIILHTRRPEYHPPWAGRPGVAELQVAPLSSGETRRIAQIRFGVDKLPDTLAQLIVDKAEGNALFVEEIARYLIERGTVRHTPGGLAYDPGAVAAALPASIQLLLTARVDRLFPEDRKLLQTAAIVGRRFDPRLLAEIDIGLSHVEDRLTAMERLDLVKRHVKSGDFEFKHVLVRDALYDSLLSSPRSELHLKVANAIERRGATRITEVAETLAYHFSQSARHDKGFRYCALAGRKCLDIYSLEESERYFRKALSLLGAAPKCADDQAMATVVANLLEVLYLRGDLLGLQELAESYIPRLQALGDTPQLVFALWFHCMLLEHRCDFSAAEVRAKLALSIAQRLNDVRAQAYAQSALLFCSTILGRHGHDAAEIEGKRVLEICLRAGDNYILNWAYWSIAWDYVCRGRTREARVWALKLIDSGRQRQDDRALGMAYWTLAWIDIQDHRFADAIANAQRCRKTAATTFDRNAGMMASATGLLLEGRFEEGLAQLLKLKKWALDNGWLYSASGVDFAAGPALAATGRIAEGIRMLKAGIAACEATGSRAMASWNRLSLAELYLQMLSSKKRPSIRFILSNLGTIVWVSMFGNRRARQLLGEVVQNDQIHELSTSRGWIEIDLARLCILRKQPDLARQHLRKAHLAASAQNSTPMLSEIDAIEQALP
jgi:class 3 adenylate cyclase/tetratricopeptide (TPR) repeat protein